MKLRNILLVFLLFFTTSIFISPIHADMGPKPSVTITIEGVDDNVEYYGALFAELSHYGPNSNNHSHYIAPKEIWNKFVEYDEVDDFYFWGNYEKLQGKHEIYWGYYPPETFKVVLYFPSTDTYLVSDIYSRYAFDTYYKIDINNKTDQGTIRLKKNYDYTWEIISFLVRAIATILIEIGIARLYFKHEKKVYQILVVINVITQLGLNVFLNGVSYYHGYISLIIFYTIAEFTIILFEGSIYQVLIPKLASQELDRRDIPRYAFVSNAASLLIGIALANMIPGLF